MKVFRDDCVIGTGEPASNACGTRTVFEGCRLKMSRYSVLFQPMQDTPSCATPAQPSPRCDQAEVWRWCFVPRAVSCLVCVQLLNLRLQAMSCVPRSPRRSQDLSQESHCYRDTTADVRFLSSCSRDGVVGARGFQTRGASVAGADAACSRRSRGRKIVIVESSGSSRRWHASMSASDDGSGGGRVVELQWNWVG